MPNSHNGVVYTKDWVVNLILDMAGYTPNRDLCSAIVCEPSCGEGAFLKGITTRLCASAANRGKLSVSEMKRAVRAFDLDERSVETSKTTVVEILCEHGLDRSDAEALANSWIRCDDFLLSDIGQVDYVIGNPPYLRATEIPAALREAYCSHLETMTRGCDLFVGFIQRGLDLLNSTGCLVYICADRWLQNQYGKRLRGYIADNGFFLNELVRMHGVDAFETEVDAYPSITMVSRQRTGLRYVDCAENFAASNVEKLMAWLKSDGGHYKCTAFEAASMSPLKNSSVMPLSTPARVKTIQALIEKYPSLENCGIELGIGLATGNDEVFITTDHSLVEPERLLPAFSMRDWRRKNKAERWLINPWNEDNSLVSLEDYPKLKRYLERNREALEKRHVAKRGSWYRTIDKPKWSLLNRPMLLFPDMAAKADPVFSNGEKYPCHNCYWMVSNEWDLEVLGGLLMSDTAESFVEAMCVKMRGKTLRFQAQYLRLIHIPYPDSISEEIARQLKIAFRRRDRAQASSAAKLAYGLR